jgi:predicted DNA-binding protein
MGHRGPRATPTEQPMYVRLPRDLHQEVKARSEQEDRTMAQTIRQALKYYLDNTQPLTVRRA